MAFHRSSKGKSKSPRSTILVLGGAVAAIAFLFLLSSLVSTTGSSKSHLRVRVEGQHHSDKYIYWGNRIDCPGKHCGSCEGLGHQESSLRCALEEAIYLRRMNHTLILFKCYIVIELLLIARTFVMPSRMCINPIHNKKGILHHSSNASSEEQWAASSCAMDSLYDPELMSETVPVILDNSKEWYQVQSTSMKLGGQGSCSCGRS
ncbi:hypothetical protein SESBI_04608 [Sesbania bispinosa]|nr:hypothetical protein SESBI_04608 [Sesbania bispinosa]